MNYKIIQDDDELKKFIHWLPSVDKETKYYVSLFARRKYGATDGLKADKGQLKRFVSGKRDLFDKIKKLEVEIGLYKVGDLQINENSLVMYITPNPRDMHKASFKTMKNFLEEIEYDRKINNPITMVYNNIQTSGVKLFYDIDVDFTPIGKTKDKSGILQDILTLTDEFINREALSIIDTNGGYHILIKKDKVDNSFTKKWFMGFKNLKNEDFDTTMNDDNMIPIPGCIQGGYTPKLIKE